MSNFSAAKILQQSLLLLAISLVYKMNRVPSWNIAYFYKKTILYKKRPNIRNDLNAITLRPNMMGSYHLSLPLHTFERILQ